MQTGNAKFWFFAALVIVCVSLLIAVEAPVLVTVGVLAGLFVGFSLVSPATEEATLAITQAAGTSPASTRLPSGFGHALLRQMPAPLIVISASGRTTYANPAALEILPRYEDGVHFSQLIRAPAFVEAIAQVIMDGQDHNFAFTTIQDREKYFEARASKLPAGSDLGTDDQIVVLIEDRTRDKLATQTRTDFIANVSHELRTPLASVLGYVETLQGHAKDDPEVREKFLAIVATQAGRMRRLVEDLMSLSRIEMNAHLAPQEVLDFNRIALEVTSALLPLARKEGMQIECLIEADAPPQIVNGDHDQLCQIMTNIIDNAMRYGTEGQVITVEIAEPTDSYPGSYGISVTDTGPGIAREHIHRLTERFYRVNANTSRERGGTGLGLAIVKHILNRHGGGLQIDSTLGQGSQFTIWLPKADGDKFTAMLQADTLT